MKDLVRLMEQGKSTLEGQSGLSSTTTTPPAWMRRTAPCSPDRRAKMLEHMARARSMPRPQADFAAAAPVLSGSSAKDLVSEVIGYVVLFGVVGLLLQSRVPLYLGAFLFLTDGERIERALASVGIRLEPETIGPDIVKRSVFWFGWFALLDALKGSVPAWLAPWMPPIESWSSLAGLSLLLAIVEALTALALRRALPRLGWEIRSNGLTWTIQFAVAIAALTILVLFRPG
ncbi:hypothetical protein [Bradyrhizobium sp. DOA9]|uniref:hypothetical protein n=1 Tax=Bradyrhizobium sp. DOA9 TaxID=1126627 RepID=UPI0007236606|nr:hypothetical protein [Bradyrhizobium sp. DOA9]GAJ35123.1 hypothetical protein BDOA9_0143220 [Bradyrhizobium sp. DOA9]